MRRTVIAIAAVGIAVGAAACSTSGTHRGAQSPGAKPSAGSGVTGTWTIASCQVDVTYLDDTNMVDYYVPDTDANFRQHYADNSISGAAGLAVVITLENDSAGPAPLPTGLLVSFTDQGGNDVGNPQTFNDVNGTGYGGAIAHGHGSGEKFTAGTLFEPGQTVAESPDLAAPVPQQPDLNCKVSISAAN
jgi:hypothetical protein